MPLIFTLAYVLQYFIVFHSLLHFPLSHHSNRRITTVRNVIPAKLDNLKCVLVCLSCTHFTQNTPSISVMK